jgi:hypothetical protein
MKRILVIVVLCTAAIPLKAQRNAFDSTEYIFGLPVTYDDTVRQVFPDHPPKDVLVKVPENEIPKRLRKSLDKDGIYSGWEKRGVFRDKNTGLYIISIREKTSTRTYGLNGNGKPVTYDEHSAPADSIE